MDILTFEKSIFAGRNLSVGDIIKYDDLTFKKPGDGISAADYNKIIGLKLLKPIKFNQMFSWDMDSLLHPYLFLTL